MNNYNSDLDELKMINSCPIEKRHRWLFYGIGNVGRQDDGLGIRFIEALAKKHLPEQIDLQENYQLNVEDSLEISNYDIIIFVDASTETNAKAPFQVRIVQPSSEIAFSTHAMSMESIVALAEQLYQRQPRAFVLTIPGYEWDIAEQLSPNAQNNLDVTIAHVTHWLSQQFE